MNKLNLLFKKYTIKDLDTLSIFEEKHKWRDYIHIAIIDDEGLSEAKINGLRSRNFNIQTLTDVENIRLLNDYPIVISDVHGVGHKIDPDLEGFALISELAKIYPFKGLAIYSGRLHKLPSLPEGVMVINKDDDLTTWTEKIDNLIDRISNPKSVWVNFAKKLIDLGVSTKELNIIEDEFVRSILQKNSFSNFMVNRKDISEATQTVILGLISNGMFFAMSKLLGI